MTPPPNDAVWIDILETPLCLEAVGDFLRAEEAGGVDIFLGTTRRWTETAPDNERQKTERQETERQETERLEYECYKPMALNEMRRISGEAFRRWPLCRACLLHRIGEVPVRETSVIVGVAAPHRAEAFAACRYLIDALKSRAPIWKKEHFADGSAEWVAGRLAPDGVNEADTT